MLSHNFQTNYLYSISFMPIMTVNVLKLNFLCHTDHRNHNIPFLYEMVIKSLKWRQAINRWIGQFFYSLRLLSVVII